MVPSQWLRCECMMLPWCVHGAEMDPWCFYEGFVVGAAVLSSMVGSWYLCVVGPWCFYGASMVGPWWVRGGLLAGPRWVDGSMGIAYKPPRWRNNSTLINGKQCTSSHGRNLMAVAWQCLVEVPWRPMEVPPAVFMKARMKLSHQSVS